MKKINIGDAVYFMSLWENKPIKTTVIKTDSFRLFDSLDVDWIYFEYGGNTAIHNCFHDVKSLKAHFKKSHTYMKRHNRKRWLRILRKINKLQ